jgi:hypothetical protein
MMGVDPLFSVKGYYRLKKDAFSDVFSVCGGWTQTNDIQGMNGNFASLTSDLRAADSA